VKLAVGPLLYFWERETVLAFYERLRALPVDVVYLGETVCPKRRVLRRRDWFRLADDLSRAGKEVVLSTLALIEAESDLAYMARTARESPWLLEANDLAVVEELGGRPFVAGPHMNIYNGATLSLLVQAGALRWVAPIELDLATLAMLLAMRPAGLEVEVFAYGRMPLAFSARCFAARAHSRPKDDCGFVCQQYPDGLTVYSQDEQAFLAINGIQTQSARVHNALAYVAGLRRIGVDVLRLSPHSTQAVAFERVIEVFRCATDRDDSSDLTLPECPTTTLPGGYCNGFLPGTAGMSLAPGR
jgi:collagenase-like PrtC family protease